jgi:hypothetical protein
MRPGEYMTRSLGNELPEALRQLLDGSQLAEREGMTFLLLTTDEANWPQVAMLSVGELVAVDARTLRAGLWLHSTTSKNLTRSGQATLMFVANGNGYYVRVAARRGPDLDVAGNGRLAYFALKVELVQVDSTDYARLTSGVTFKLNDPDQVLSRWQHTVDALRAAERSSNSREGASR